MNFNKKIALLILFQKDRRYKFRDLKSALKVDNTELARLITELRGEGYRITHHKLDKTFSLSKVPTPYSDLYPMTHLPKEGIVGLISDTHLCSDADRLDLCEEAYNLFQKEGCKVVLHAGDLSDGWNVYRNHKQFVKCIGGQAQAKYIIRNYPKRDGIKTYYIGGN